MTEHAIDAVLSDVDSTLIMPGTSLPVGEHGFAAAMGRYQLVRP
jgi:hypothetical protein